jgi:hypothetical protein
MGRARVAAFGACVALLVACGNGGATTSASPTGVSDGSSAPTTPASTTPPASPRAEAYSDNRVSFDYPLGWQSLNITSSSASTNGSVVWQEAFGPGPGSDFVSVTDYSINASITADNIDQEEPPTTDSITSLFQQAGGSLTSGPDRITMGGLPALGYAGTALDPDGNQVDVRMVLAYDGTTEYYVNCQGSGEGATAIAAACDQIVGSFTLTT